QIMPFTHADTVLEQRDVLLATLRTRPAGLLLPTVAPTAAVGGAGGGHRGGRGAGAAAADGRDLRSGPGAVLGAADPWRRRDHRDGGRGRAGRPRGGRRGLRLGD